MEISKSSHQGRLFSLGELTVNCQNYELKSKMIRSEICVSAQVNKLLKIHSELLVCIWTLKQLAQGKHLGSVSKQSSWYWPEDISVNTSDTVNNFKGKMFPHSQLQITLNWDLCTTNLIRAYRKYVSVSRRVINFYTYDFKVLIF